MHNFTGEHLHVIENVGCRCKICKGSIFKSQKRQDVDAIVHDRQAEKYLQVRRKASCRYIGQEKSIYNSEYQGIADTSDTRKVNPSSLHLFQSRYTTKQEKDYAIQRIGVGLARRSWAGVHSLFLLRGCRELNSKWICLPQPLVDNCLLKRYDKQRIQFIKKWG